MTDEEINRKFDVVAEHLATLAVGLQTLEAQVAETNRQLQAHAETQSQFIEIATRTLQGLADNQARTDANLDRLARLVERHVSDGHGN